jgi:hypothetical protein
MKNQRTLRREIPFTFENKNGRNLVGIIHLPEKEKLPLVIICHGFQETKTNKRLVLLARKLREKGILAVRFDFEGCGDSEGNPKEITIQDEVCDLCFAYKHILNQCNIDPSRVAFVGESLASVVITLAIVNFKLPARTVVFWSQAFDQKSLLKRWYHKEELRELQRKGVIIKGTKEIGKRYYYENRSKDYSEYLSKLKIPVLIIHGDKDEDVPLEFSQRMADKHSNVTLRILRNAEHKFEDPLSRKQAISLTTKWLEKYLLKR